MSAHPLDLILIPLGKLRPLQFSLHRLFCVGV